MCEYTGRLVAWLDGELPDEEAGRVEGHVGQCAECRKAVRAYDEVSRAFLECCEMAGSSPKKPHRLRWATALGGLAAAAAMVAAVMVAAIVSMQPPVEKLSYHPPLPPPAPVITARARIPVRRHAVPVRAARPWMASEPVVQVALPADALFPPGAVPEGFSFIADVRFQQ